MSSLFTTLLTSLALAAQSVYALEGNAPSPPASFPNHGGFGNIKTLVTFGDSYTDEGRLGYLQNNGGKLPPLGWVPPKRTDHSGMGIPWARLVSDRTGIHLENYAIGGSACNNDITYRSTQNFEIPDVQGYAVDRYIREHFNVRGPRPFFPFEPKTTLFSIWIGTNDLGPGDFMTDSNAAGTSLANFTDCHIEWMNTLYGWGARHFAIMSLVPLQHAPQYASAEDGGTTSENHYWPEKDSWMNGNRTAISIKMREMVLTSNDAFSYKIPYAASKLKDAKVAYFDAYQVMMNIRNNPKQYLEQPYNTTGYVSHCRNRCSENYLIDDGKTVNGFMWWDEVHPTEKTSSVIADEFSKMINGTSNLATYYFK